MMPNVKEFGYEFDSDLSKSCSVQLQILISTAKTSVNADKLR